MAHKKGGGSSRNGRDSQGQRLGENMVVVVRSEIYWFAPGHQNQIMSETDDVPLTVMVRGLKPSVTIISA
jgi:hypothetical protein